MFIIIVIVTFFLLTYQATGVVGNPIPLDEKYETSPVSSSDGGSISFTKELINVTFDSSMTYFKAIYTFKNTKENTTKITIQLPLKDYKGPDDLTLQNDQTDLDYKWVNIKIQLDEDQWEEDFRALEFTLSFAANEEIDIVVQYSRPYTIYDFSGNKEVHYSYKYLVGTARAWNRPLTSAYFEFWIPEDICDRITLWPDFQTTSSVVVEPFRVVSVSFSNWTPEDDYILLRWTKDKPFAETGSYPGFFTVLLYFGIIVVFVHGHKKA